MKKRFWKIEYSITIFVVFAIILLLIPTSFISSKEATYISKWNETFNKIDYTFTAMSAQADADIVKSLHRAKTNEERERLMIQLIKPYLRIHNQDEITKKYIPHYMNGNKVNKKDLFYFEKVYDKDYYKDKFEVVYVMAQLYDKLAEETKAYTFYEKASKIKPINSSKIEIAILDNMIFQNHDKIIIALLK